ncbi:MAG: DUF11 domain-containing protein [Chloroflexota bacterium]
MLGIAVLVAPWVVQAQAIPPRNDRLVVCLKPAGGAELDGMRALQTLQAALDEVARHPNWWRLDFTAAAPAAELNCEHEPVLLQPGVTVTRGAVSSSRTLPADPEVERRGKYELFVVVLPPEEIERLFPGYAGEHAKYRTATEEMVCERRGAPPRGEKLCAELSAGLYLTPDEVLDRQLLVDALVLRYDLNRPPSPGEPTSPAERRPTPLTIADPGKPYPAVGSGAGAADLTVSGFTVSPEPLVGGREATITYTVQNLGPARATAVRLFNTLPNGVKTRGLRVSQGGCAYSPRIVCDVGDLDVGGTVMVTADALADNEADGEGSYRVTAVAREPDPRPRNNSGARVVTVGPAPDLVVSAEVSPKIAAVGQEVTYTFTVTNRGPGPVTGVDLTDNYLPSTMRLVRIDARCQAPAPTPGVPAAFPGSCPLGDLASGESTTVTTVMAPSTPGAHRHTVAAFAREPSRDRANQDDEVWLMVDPTVDLAVTLSSSPVPVQAGDPLSLTVTVENRMAVAANEVSVSIPVPPNTTLVRSDEPPMDRACVSMTETELGCSVRRLEGGASTNMTIAIVAGPVGDLPLTASVRSKEGDLDLANNTASVTTTIVPRACAPLPDVLVKIDPGAADRLRVTVESTTNASAPENRLGRLRFGADSSNALLDFPETLDGRGPAVSGRTGAFDYHVGRLSRTVFFVRRAQAGQAVSVPLTVQDDCGSWSTVIQADAAPWGNAFALQMSASPTGAIRVGDEVTYTTSIANRGTTGAEGTVGVMTLPEGLSFVAARTNTGGCGGTQTVICDFGRLDVNGSATMTVVARATRPGTYAVMAYAASVVFDGDDAENAVSLTTEVQP